MIKKHIIRNIFFVLTAAVLINCNRGYGCPSDQYNNYSPEKKKTTSQNINSNKKVKDKKPVSQKMSPY